jgi:fumarate reductase subunit D
LIIKMVEKKEDLSSVSYIFGIMSIVLAFFTPLAGLIFGIIGFSLGKKQKTSLAKKGKKLSKIGLIISIVVLVITIFIAIFAAKGTLGNFPLG